MSGIFNVSNSISKYLKYGFNNAADKFVDRLWGKSGLADLANNGLSSIANIPGEKKGILGLGNLFFSKLPFLGQIGEMFSNLLGKMVEPLQKMVTTLAETMHKLFDVVKQFTDKLSSIFGGTNAASETAQDDAGAIDGGDTPATDSGAGCGCPTTDGSGAKDNVDPARANRMMKTGEFLWKPVSDSNGKLVILTPSKYSKLVKKVEILSPDGKNVLERGKYRGIANGNRAHFRFSKEGSAYPNNSIVRITLSNGKVMTVRIADTSQRYTR
ncbi:MAG TPA: hypothetical protein PKD37_03180 [Oligoflexia bacterium]|nr:hypothetical protein [Oligoflexia bacterium]HMP26971.1 hypothetical protein [Oligoflexia bacterium]